jgi:sodium/glucose cotransporter 1
LCVCADPTEEPGCCKKAVLNFCGLEKSNAPALSAEEQAELQRKLTDTSEKPLWRNVVNANGIILLCVCVFFHGFYG